MTPTSYSHEAQRHVHKVPWYHLRGVRRIQVCLPPSDDLKSQLQRFKRIWDQTVSQLQARGLGKLVHGVSVAFTSRRGYYARFWHDNILCVNLKDFLGQGSKGPGILLHELGHRVWFGLMSQKTRARWSADHHARRRMERGLFRRKSGSFVSSYAKTDALEDHAEAFKARVEGTLSGHAKTRYERIAPKTRAIQQRLAR